MPRIAALLCGLAVLHGAGGAPLRAQDPAPPALSDSSTLPAGDTVEVDSTHPFPAARTSARIRGLAILGGVEDERLRLAQLTGRAPLDGSLLRSVSTLVPRRADRFYLVPLAPRGELVWNKEIPFSVNDGPLWAGRGLSSRLLAGVEAAAGPLRLVLAPELVRQGNDGFESVTPARWDTTQPGVFTPPWLRGAHSADLPFRMGDEGRTVVFLGESSLTLRAGPVEAGAATESQWWGPGVRSALLMSNQAGGFPHLLLRTAAPIRTPLGKLEGRWIIGRLTSSPYDTASVGRERSLSGAALVLSPTDGVQLGAARVVYQAADDRNAAEDAGDVFLRWRGAGDTLAAEPYEQIVAFWGRWVIPEHGAEVYAEWGRKRLASFRDLLEQPEHTQGYTLGLAWARPAASGRLRLRGEVAYLEKSSTYRAQPTISWYAGRAVPQGYTHRGQVLGAFMGPGASGQWVGVDYVAPRAQAGISLIRVRWANDAYYTQPTIHITRYRAHDVSILGALHGGIAAGPVWLDAEWTLGRRYNFLFQNPAGDWPLRYLSTSPFNHTLRLSVSVVPELPRF